MVPGPETRIGVLSTPVRDVPRHPRWVRLSHWILATAVLTLAVSGVIILMAHPRLYWGEVAAVGGVS